MAVTKYVSAWHGGRDNYQVQKALHQADLLDKLIVEASPSLVNALKNLTNPGTNLRQEVIPDGYIYTSKLAFLSEVTSKIKFYTTGKVDYYQWLYGAMQLGKKAGELSTKNQSALLSELYSAHWSFQNTRNTNTYKVLYQGHPYSEYLVPLYKRSKYTGVKHYESYPLETEMEIGAPAKYRTALRQAAIDADKIVCPSTFVKHTLVTYGIDESKISVTPLGVDRNLFYIDGTKDAHIFNMLFVGQSVERKGLNRLINSWSKLKLKNSILTLVGRDINYNVQLSESCKIQSVGRLTDSNLRQAMSKSDMLVLPSIAEGFGLVLLQSLACGTPVMATDNTGLQDIISQGNVGKIIPFDEIDNLSDYLQWAYDNKDSLGSLTSLCTETADTFSWGSFRKNILNSLNH